MGSQHPIATHTAGAVAMKEATARDIDLLRARPIAAPPTPSAMHDDKRRRRRALSATGRSAASEVRGKDGPRGTRPSAAGSAPVKQTVPTDPAGFRP